MQWPLPSLPWAGSAFSMTSSIISPTSWYSTREHSSSPSMMRLPSISLTEAHDEPNLSYISTTSTPSLPLINGIKIDFWISAATSFMFTEPLIIFVKTPSTERYALPRYPYPSQMVSLDSPIFPHLKLCHTWFCLFNESLLIYILNNYIHLCFFCLAFTTRTLMAPIKPFAVFLSRLTLRLHGCITIPPPLAATLVLWTTNAPCASAPLLPTSSSSFHPSLFQPCAPLCFYPLPQPSPFP